MTIFEELDRINFVDKNNVLVGFENDQQCCESFGYEFQDENGDEITFEDENLELQDFIFDTDYLVCYLVDLSIDENGDEEDVYNVIKLRLVNENSDEIIYLELHNHHNGYYGHGFKVKVDDETIFEDVL